MSNNLGSSNKMLTLREAADLLSVAPNTLYNEWRAWGIPFYRLGMADRGRLRVRERDLWNWLETRRQRDPGCSQRFRCRENPALCQWRSCARGSAHGSVSRV
jgi:hypothetical protein